MNYYSISYSYQQQPKVDGPRLHSVYFCRGANYQRAIDQFRVDVMVLWFWVTVNYVYSEKLPDDLEV